jgi:hypothetical protein
LVSWHNVYPLIKAVTATGNQRYHARRPRVRGPAWLVPRASAAVPPKRQLRANLVSAREARPKTPTASRPSSSSFQIARVPRCLRAGTPTSRRRRRANAVHDADLPRRRQRCHRRSAGPVARGRRPFGRGHDSLSREGRRAPRARSRAGRVPTGSKRSAVTTGLATRRWQRPSKVTRALCHELERPRHRGLTLAWRDKRAPVHIADSSQTGSTTVRWSGPPWRFRAGALHVSQPNAQRTAGSGPAGPGIGESQVWADAVARSCFGARAGTQARRRDSPASRDTRPAARTGTIGRQRHAPGLLASGGSRASAGAQGAGDGA